jgi:hypothetical protein
MNIPTTVTRLDYGSVDGLLQRPGSAFDFGRFGIPEAGEFRLTGGWNSEAIPGKLYGEPFGTTGTFGATANFMGGLMIGDDIQEHIFDPVLGVKTRSAVMPYRVMKGLIRDYSDAMNPRRMGGEPPHAAADAVFGDYPRYLQLRSMSDYMQRNNDLPAPANPYFADRQSKEVYELMFGGTRARGR